ncbi:hypothetical protein ACLK2I_01110 [Escherichia coli]
MLRYRRNACGSCGDQQNYDERGIVWPDAIAPFQVAILPMNMTTLPRTGTC